MPAQCTCSQHGERSQTGKNIPLKNRDMHSMGNAAAQAVQSRHVPRSVQEAEEARQRLAFEELLVLQLRLLLQRTSFQCAALTLPPSCPSFTVYADVGWLSATS